MTKTKKKATTTNINPESKSQPRNKKDAERRTKNEAQRNETKAQRPGHEDQRRGRGKKRRKHQANKDPTTKEPKITGSSKDARRIVRNQKKQERKHPPVSWLSPSSSTSNAPSWPHSTGSGPERWRRHRKQQSTTIAAIEVS